jgi:hypothetical protein
LVSRHFCGPVVGGKNAGAYPGVRRSGGLLCDGYCPASAAVVNVEAFVSFALEWSAAIATAANKPNPMNAKAAWLVVAYFNFPEGFAAVVGPWSNCDKLAVAGFLNHVAHSAESRFRLD